MRKLALLLMCCYAAPAQATLLFYDGFDYGAPQPLAPKTDTAGTPVPGPHNVAYNVDWRYAGTGAANANTPTVGSGGLSYAGLQDPAAGSNSVAYDPTQIGTARIQVTPAAISSGTVYWSGLLKVTAVNTLTTNTAAGSGLMLGAFNNTAGAQVTAPTALGALLAISKDASDTNNVRYFLATGVNASNRVFATSAPQNTGDTVFVVASYTFVSGTNNDIAKMWINPSVSDFGAGTAPTPTISISGSGADPFTSLISFNIRNANTVGAPSVQFDELRVGDDWASVTPAAVPEASAALFVLLGGVFVAGRKAIKPLARRVARPK